MPPLEVPLPSQLAPTGFPSPLAPTGFPSPLRGGVRGGGNPDGGPSELPPTLSLPHKGGGDDAAAVGESHPGSPAGDAPDPDGPIWQDGEFRRNAWARPEAEGALPDSPVILPKNRWVAERDRLANRNAPLGLQIEPGEAIDDIAPDLPRFALIALSFPKFTDGRAFSTARLLREKHGFKGELRAVGNVLSDQIAFMRRVGFDSFEVTHAPTRRALAEGRIADVSLYYQPTGVAEPSGGTRPWLRRSPP